MESLIRVGISIVLWTMIGLYAASTLFWLYEMVVVTRRLKPSEPVWDATDVQIRVLTIGRESVVQSTVDALPSTLDEVHVVAEKPLRIEGATVHVVPDDFVCEATHKGRAVEWARRTVPCDREYVLYLDEDTLVPSFDGLPDADVVQLREKPIRTRSRLAYYAEILRMGFQLEQRAFPGLGLPLYAWGGGLAVRKSLEDRITWDEDTIIEDTTFTWRAVVERGATFALSPTVCFNQAPPSVRSMIAQRRRWIAGSREENPILPSRYFLLYGLRNATWGLSSLVPVVGLAPLLSPAGLTYESAYVAASATLFAFLLGWSVLGVRYYGESLGTGLLVVALTPVLTVVHSAGALYGLVSPPEGFRVTEKVPPAEMPDVAVRETSVRLPVPIRDLDTELHFEDDDGNVWVSTDDRPENHIESERETEPESETEPRAVKRR